jgi:N-acyl amino acid synthase of PEP-CTERM/exosortase system
VGTARLVFSADRAHFPFESHCPAFPDFEFPPAELAVEVSRLAVSRTYRRRAGDTRDGVNEQEIGERPSGAPPGVQEKRVNAPLLVLGLYREMYRYSRENGIRYWYAAMERSLTRVLGHYGFAFTPIGPESDYYGPVTPYIGDLQKIEEDLEQSNPDLLWWFRYGP